MGIIISTLDFPEEIKNRLQDQHQAGLIFDELAGKDYTAFKIDFKQKKQESLEYLANIIADIVIEYIKKKFLNNIIRNRYQEFSLAEQNMIEEMTVDNLDKLLQRSNKPGNILSKEEIVKKILTYFHQNENMNLEGFVRFRLKDIIDEIEMAIEMSVDDFIIQKEYNEFIDLLRYFVELQEPRIDLVNVIKKKNGSFQILDQERKEISSEYLEGYLADMFKDEVEYEDLLVSALINLAPQKIRLHFQRDEVEETVRRIFGQKVEICRGCSLCQYGEGIEN
ncbi:MAG: putative sporulation protein YtxC [Halanaerobiales bacterium]|nr:putative sporulation protein YtxC [Bacillota bacterium]HOA40705.1 putative sporulation protein YtxC [Halanaerobiales bacterium]HPZ63031.1 putative sporulation protein YtxC [Halanaerobiales bacterium]HQD04509.1 putative sporulation protein YtxC [Halanaerobiales bacterium]